MLANSWVCWQTETDVCVRACVDGDDCIDVWMKRKLCVCVGEKNFSLQFVCDSDLVTDSGNSSIHIVSLLISSQQNKKLFANPIDIDWFLNEQLIRLCSLSSSSSLLYDGDLIQIPSIHLNSDQPVFRIILFIIHFVVITLQYQHYLPPSNNTQSYLVRHNCHFFVFATEIFCLFFSHLDSILVMILLSFCSIIFIFVIIS